MSWVVGLIALNLAFTFVIPALGGQQISWQGHIGGLVTGGLALIVCLLWLVLFSAAIASVGSARSF